LSGSESVQVFFIVYGQCPHFLGKQKYIEQYNNVWSV